MTVSKRQRTMTEVSGWYARGLAMGIADMVPGISGGTLALIMGIYARLIAALASFRLSLLPLLARGRVAEAWRRIDGNFLATLLAGILTSIALMSHLVTWMLEEAPVVLWGIFLGILLLALGGICRRVTWHGNALLAALAGAAVAMITVIAGGIAVEATPLWMFFGGMIAITAMILPGISGTLLLLLLGLYAPAVEAVREADWLLLGIFASGCLTGVLVFSRLLHWVMQNYSNLALAGMSGIVVGALPRLWPWQYEPAAAALQVRWPDSGADLLAGLLSCAAGAGLYLLIGWWHRRRVGSNTASGYSEAP